MKTQIKKAEDVKVGDEMEWGGYTRFCHERTKDFIGWRTGGYGRDRVLSNPELDDMLSKGFVITREVEPVVRDLQVFAIHHSGDYIGLPTGLGIECGDLVRVSIERITPSEATSKAEPSTATGGGK